MKLHRLYSPFTIHSSRGVNSPFTLHHSRGSSASNHSPFTLHHSRGFTVLELAVVLVVIGLMVGGVLKLEQVYRNYKIRQVVNQYRELNTAIKVYRDRFGYWPGDDPRANVHVGSTLGNGNGDDMMDYAEYDIAYEHLSRAGLIKGSYIVRTDRMYHVFGREIYFVANYLAGRKYNFIRFSYLPGDVALALDTALDDGIYNTGQVQGGNSQFISGTDWAIVPVQYPNDGNTVTTGIMIQ